MAAISARVRPPTWTCCWRKSEAMSLPGFIGILLGLGLLIWLAFRGWSVLLLAPIAALIAALFSREPDALLRHLPLGRAGTWRRGVADHARFWPVVGVARGGCRTQERRGLRWRRSLVA